MTGMRNPRIVGSFHFAYLDASNGAHRGSRRLPKVEKMSVTETNNAAPLGSITAFRFVAAVERARDAFAAWRGARATERTLLALSDKQLSDIGLHRGDISALADTLARR